jgi:polyhydroxybutyrate depolymerase
MFLAQFGAAGAAIRRETAPAARFRTGKRPELGMMRAMRTFVLMATLATLAGCGGGKTGSMGNKPETSPLILARPYTADVPDGWYNDTPLPVVILLHGFGAGGYVQEAYFGFNRLVNDHKVIVVAPNGTLNQDGALFWNATDACCDAYGQGVDDVAYLSAVIDDVKINWMVDADHIYVVGHSNGGYMAHRLGCEIADKLAGIVSLAGNNWKDASKCNPSRPVSALQVHSDTDETVPYTGGGLRPSAHDSMAVWAAKNGCSGDVVPTGQTLDLDEMVAGAETEPGAWSCPAPSRAAELWTMHGSMHMPKLFTPLWGDTVYAWLKSHAAVQ